MGKRIGVPEPISRYGALWPAEADDLQIELAAILKGGTWKSKSGKSCGLGLFEHYKNAMALLWPTDDWHRWTDICVKTIAENIITAIIGPADSGKTYIAGAKWALLEYWASPDTTLVVVSSTDMRGLELRVWGAIKGLFNRALDRYPYLLGRPLESLHCIATDEIDEEQERARTLNRGIVCIPCLQGGRYTGLGKYHGIKAPRLRQVSDECFPAGTLVNTPSGTVPIEQIKGGDVVISAVGSSVVLRTGCRWSDSLVSIRTKDGREIVCTPEHPFFTQGGWIKAIDLCEAHFMLSAHETMYLLRETFLPKKAYDQILQRILLSEALPKQTGNQGILFQTLEGEACSQSELEIKNSRTNEGAESDAQSEKLCQGRGKNPGAWTPTSGSWWKWNRAKQGGMATHENVSRRKMELSRKNEHAARQRIPDLLQSRSWISACETSHRGRWINSQQSFSERKGSEKGCVLKGAWVDRVEILQQTDPRFQNSGPNIGRCRVYNLQVAAHPSYSVHGLIAHNSQMMGESHLDALPNYLGKDYKGVFLGNPIDPLDPLGRIAEPVDGWTSHPEPTKTTTWKTLMHNGTCVNLVGTDSPNFDYDQEKPARFSYLISRKKIESVKAFWGEDSEQYYSQCIGVMKSGLLKRRVITRELCREHHAHDRAVWKDEKITKIYALDAAYGGTGGDRCVGGHVEFGESIEGIQIIRVIPPKVVPVSIKKPKEPEDQIAEYVQSDLSSLGIPPQNAFYDSTGRGTLGSAFARVFGATTPVPVEFGGRPTIRPVRHDLFIIDEQHPQRLPRLKRCDEHYVDFVTELWYSSRYVIECDQMRELPEEVMREGCQREYGTGAGNRIFVESKHDPKARERMRVSPDLYDWLVTAIEGARRRGFKIQRLGIVLTEDRNEHKWLRDKVNNVERLLKSKQLVYR